MNTARALLIVAIALCGLAPLAAAQTSGQALYNDCSAPEGSPSSLLCLAYVSAIADSGRAEASMVAGENMPAGVGSLLGRQWCLPEGATFGSLKDTVADWIARHPEQRTRPAAILVTEILKDAFPCI